jgi:hypothetical protein
VAALRLDSGPPGFYWMEKPFVFFAEASGADWIVRLLPFLAVALLFLAARTLPGAASRVVFVALVAASVLLNLYAAEARPYGVLGLLALALFLLGLEGEETGGRLAALCALAAAGLYTHYLAIFAVVALGLLAARAGRWKSCAALAGGAVLFVPWIPVLLRQPASAVAWMRETPAGSLAGFLSALGGVGRVPSPFGPPAHRVLFAAAALAGAALALLAAARPGADRPTKQALAFVGLVLGGILVTGLWRPIAFAGRSEVMVLPVWFWAIARGADRGRALRWLSASAAVLGAVATAGVLAAPPPGAPLEDLRANLERVAGPRDVVFASAGFYLPVRLASDQGRLRAAVRALPQEIALHPGWFVPALPGAAQEALVSRAAADLPPGGRIFLVLPPAYATPGLRAALASSAAGGSVRELVRTPEMLVLLFTPTKRPPPA